jgi:hypothetical protein
MRRTPRSRSASFVLALLLAACGDGGEGDTIASPHELRLDVISGKGVRDTVRGPSETAESVSLPIVVQVSTALNAAAQALPGATGPDLAVQIPPVEVRWRTLEPWCQAVHATTTITAGDTTSNALRIPTVADFCHLVAEGVTNGIVFDADTAAVGFSPGPIVSFDMPARVPFIQTLGFNVRGVISNARDAHGNLVLRPDPVTVITAGAPVFSVADSIVRASGEALGEMRVTAGTASRTATLWSLRNMAGSWHLTWACHDAPLADGAHADSAHYTLAEAETEYGGITGRGLGVRFTGVLRTRLWLRGQPVQETAVPRTTRFAAQRVGVLEWFPGEVATPTASGFAGGSLCESSPVQGAAWTRSAPVRAEKL